MTTRNALLVAGGGGGTDAGDAAGGAGGTPTGRDGQGNTTAGTGATQAAPGSGPYAGSANQGGTSATFGGGGGGYYGGGGGSAINGGAGGGGGASWATALATGVTFGLTVGGTGGTVSLSPALPGQGPFDGAGLTNLPAGPGDNLGDHLATRNLSLNTNFDLRLRGPSDPYHGLGWYGLGKLWTAFNVDGPVLYGRTGGILGTDFGGAQLTALSWNMSGNVGIGNVAPAAKLDVSGTAQAAAVVSLGEAFVDAGATNDGLLFGQPALKFGPSNSGEGIGSKRTTTGNQNGLDFYTGYTNRLAITSAGNVGLGLSAPLAKLDVQGGADFDGNNDPHALAFSYRTGGYRHFLRSRHNSGIANVGNDLDFYLNNSTTAAGSSAPGAGNIQVLTLESNNGLPRVGIGTNFPASTLDVRGSLGLPYVEATADLVLTTAHHTVRRLVGCNLITLPQPGTCVGRLYTIICANGTSTNLTLAVSVSGSIFDDVTASTITFLIPNNRISVQSDGTRWIVVSR